MLETTYQKYIKIISRYLLIYMFLHLLVILVLFGFERGWVTFIYLILFLPHLPMVLVGSILTFIGKKRRNAYIWLAAMFCFLLSNVYWIYYLLYQEFDIAVQVWILVTLVPIYYSYRLYKLVRN